MADHNNYEHNKIEVGKRVANIRECMKMSQPMFAEFVELSSNFLSQVENGNKGLSGESVARISIKTGYSTDYILLGKTQESIISPDFRNRIREHLLESMRLLDQ